MDGTCSVICGWNSGLLIEEGLRYFGWNLPIAVTLTGRNFFFFFKSQNTCWICLICPKGQNRKPKYLWKNNRKIVFDCKLDHLFFFLTNMYYELPLSILEIYISFPFIPLILPAIYCQIVILLGKKLKVPRI